MFEEDFERCFMCQQPCKGLYCSSECRTQDKGKATSPTAKLSPGPVRLTAQLPATLSPLVRPAHPIGPSPRLPPSNTDSSSSSSINSSPIQSPQTNPSTSGSPRKEAFDLPPPAYPNPSSLAFSGSVPVKIPNLLPRTVPLAPVSASNGSTVNPDGASMETLRFGRKSGVVNSVTSPNALLPRCSCGKAAGHHGRAPSKDRNAMDSAFSHFNLGPALSSHEHRSNRIVSESAIPTAPLQFPVRDHKAKSGHTTPKIQVGDLMGGSLLSRSRSDPIPPSPKASRTLKALALNRASPSRRASHADHIAPAQLQAVAPGGGAPSSVSRAGRVALSQVPMSPRRGRSRERQAHPLNGEVAGLLNHPPEREHPPSRSRPRRLRSDEEQRERRAPPEQVIVAPSIMPSWSRRESSVGERLTPLKKNASGGNKSPGAGEEANMERKKEEMRRASKQLGRVFGVAAG